MSLLPRYWVYTLLVYSVLHKCLVLNQLKPNQTLYQIIRSNTTYSVLHKLLDFTRILDFTQILGLPQILSFARNNRRGLAPNTRF